jgi:hypothetical protein
MLNSGDARGVNREQFSFIHSSINIYAGDAGFNMPLANIWTLVSGSSEQTLALWGIARAVITRKSQDADLLQISVPDAAFDAAVLFAFESQVTIKRYPSVDSDGNPTGTPVKWFVGTCVKTPRTGRPNAEGMDYEFQGPWYALANIVYQQNWTMFDGGTQVTSPQSRVNLFANVEGALITTAAQITDALTWALGSTSLFQAGSLMAGISVPTEQGTDLTCAEVVKRALRWHPDAVTWVDYTQTPPALNIGLRSALTAASVAVTGAPANELDILSRDDLVHPVVSIKYSQVNTVNGQQALSQAVDKYPTGASEDQLRALVLSVDLAGANSSYLSQDVVTAALPSDTGSGSYADIIAWFVGKLPELADASVLATGITYTASSLNIAAINDDGSPSSGAVYGAELVDGQIADWMSVHAQLVLVTAQLSYTQLTKDSAGNSIYTNMPARTVQVKVLSTDANTQTYQSLGTTVPGDPMPMGLAENFYNALAQLQYEGAFALLEQEVGTIGGPFSGQVLNLTGSRSEWTTMKAMVHTVVEDIATGKTTLRFGPHTYLSAADMVAHLRATRQRVIPELAERADAISTGGAQVLPKTQRKQSQGKVETTPSLDVWFGAPVAGPPATPGTNKVTIQLTAIPSGLPAENLVMTPQIVSVGCPGGANQVALILMSGTWTPS